MNGYTKLFGSIVTSTVWRLDVESKVVWVTMLAICDMDGMVQASVPGLAHVAGVSVEATERAIAAFLAPDPHSRTKEHEGRRIVEIDGGWMLLNHGKYRDLLSLEDRKAKAAERKRRERDRKKAGTNVTLGHALSRSVTLPSVSASASGSGSDLDEDPDLNEGTEGTRARAEPPAPPPVPPTEPPDWFTAALGVIAMGTGIELPTGEAWLGYSGHRAGKGIAGSQADAQYWLTRVLVPEVRERQRRDARDAERTEALKRPRVVEPPPRPKMSPEREREFTEGLKQRLLAKQKADDERRAAAERTGT